MNRDDNNLYLFPFRKLSVFLHQQLDVELKVYYDGYLNEQLGHRINNLDRHNHQISILKDEYSSGEDEYFIITFEKKIRPQILEIIRDSILTIENGIDYCHVSNQSLAAYLNRIRKEYSKLYDNAPHGRYPFLQSYLEILINEIDSFDSKNDETSIFSISNNSIFEVKEGVKISIFKDLYSVAMAHQIFVDDCTENNFIEVLTQDTTNTLQFNCDSSLAITFLEGIKVLYENFTSVSIEKSRSFLTKTGEILSATNYSTSKNRLKVNSKTIDLSEEISTLLSQID
ncbi:hypothetical protein [Croceivirga sp. JEA036]|uniref:hypothetical protein n=1 Tax=Croceivirga sp. JEA036 TaxID=2721162 RepID=UPI00143CB1B8|nr:hypothetical protein [Croceivirga sp. JEA036]NJB35307.1 hypothetical protein [Croceivirga sp. JEA036]